jgi:hypothetical protein
MVNCLDNVSMEVIHSIFIYLSGIDIFRSFLNLNKSINNKIKCYDKYEFNLKKICKKDFYFILNNLNPSKVISLTLSNDKLTPGLMDLFLNKFQIEEFFKLRYLDFYSLDLEKYSKNIFSKLSQLKELEILIINECYLDDDDSIHSLILNNSLKYFSLSFRNNLPYGSYLFNLANLNQIEYLNCQFDEHVNLSKLCFQMPLLHTLIARISSYPPSTALLPIISPKLKRLQLNFNNGLLGS